jgi:hypothetical protein
MVMTYAYTGMSSVAPMTSISIFASSWATNIFAIIVAVITFCAIAMAMVAADPRATIGVSTSGRAMNIATIGSMMSYNRF